MRRGTGSPPHDEDEQPKPPSQLIKVAGAFVLLALLITVAMVARRFTQPPSTPAPPARGDDGRIQAMIDEYGRDEAREALAAPRRDILGAVWSRQQALHRIDEWYKLGAKQVLAFGGIMISALVIELPDDPVRRRPFFDFFEQWRREHHPKEPPVKDDGQKFLLIDLT